MADRAHKFRFHSTVNPDIRCSVGMRVVRPLSFQYSNSCYVSHFGEMVSNKRTVHKRKWEEAHVGGSFREYNQYLEINVPYSSPESRVSTKTTVSSPGKSGTRKKVEVNHENL
eukprot:scaffold37339_cov194-Skeletonema_dohrnii-CCMP3373.AAC.1